MKFGADVANELARGGVETANALADGDARSRGIRVRTREELSAMTAPRLLAYYRAERARFLRFDGGATDYNGRYVGDLGRKAEAWKAYLGRVREVLSAREHVPR